MKQETVPQSDDPGYRDYLVAIVNTYITEPAQQSDVIEIDPASAPPPQQLLPKTLADLRKRFKQDFSTIENDVIGANKVAVDVITKVLVEDLGIVPGTIPAQQNHTDREYLLTLIGLSGQTVEALSVTYRSDLSRSDLDKTTKVHENILTLQRYLRDGNFEPKVNPFFHYKDEWRLRYLTLFFPENHYGLKTGLFATSADRQRALTLATSIENHKDYKKQQPIKSFLDRLKIFMSVDSQLTAAHRQFIAEEFDLALAHYRGAKKAIEKLSKRMNMKVFALPADGSKIYEDTLYPNLISAEAFRKSLDPENRYPGKKLFGVRPPWGGSYWNPGKHHEGKWKEGLKKGWWKPIDMPNKVPDTYPFTSDLFKRLTERYDKRANLQVTNAKELNALQALNTVVVRDTGQVTSLQGKESALLELNDDLVSLLPHVLFLLLPVCFGDVAHAKGDVIKSCQQYAQVVKEELLRGSLATDPGAATPNSSGDLPWTRDDYPHYANLEGRDYPYLNIHCEQPYLLLRLGKVHLDWAERLYRADQESDVYRARELYKSVLGQYGLDPVPGEGLSPLPLRIAEPPITRGYEFPTVIDGQPLSAAQPASATPDILQPRGTPQGPQPEFEEIMTDMLENELAEMEQAAKVAWSPLIEAKIPPITFVEYAIEEEADITSVYVVLPVLMPTINPAILAQQMRARIGLTQIDAGLNYYGYDHFLVPLLRYRPLAATAQRFAALSKQAESDFLTYKENAEKGELALIQARSAVAATAISVRIEGERIAQAKDYIYQAEVQVKQVRDAIAAKRAEIADHDSLCGQVEDFFIGIKDFFSGVPDKAKDYVKSDYSAAFGFDKAAAGATAGLGVVGGMGLFAIGAGVTLSGVADSANRRVGELEKLEKQQLPLALVGLDARKRELSIAQMQKAVATLEVMTAQEVLRHSLLKTLNADMWTQMGTAMRSVLRRYLELGAMTGWLAERALAYAQDRDLRLIRLDYFDRRRHGLLGADALQSDLAILEKEYITGMQQMVPIKWTVSLACDFPLQFGQLKKSGVCAFLTTSEQLDRGHPGSFGHRVRALSVNAILPVSEPRPRGLLSNSGVSLVQGPRLDNWHYVVRSPDVLPLSEFDLNNDIAVYQLPGETLLPFEGSGVDTVWMLSFPQAANPTGLAALADVELTFYLQSRYSSTRLAELNKAGLPVLTRSVLLSAKQLFAKSLKTFREGSDGDVLTFAVTPDLLSHSERNRQVTNVAVYFIGRDLPEVTATLKSDEVPGGVKFTTKNGLAHSNKVPQPAVIPVAAAALDAMLAGAPEQVWHLELLAVNNGVLNRKSIEEVILGIEYTADTGCEY
jgi:hypothetical protein